MKLSTLTVSWKTTVTGVLMFISSLAGALIAILDGNPDTVADWNIVVVAFSGMLALLFAKDADKATEDHR